MIDDTGILDHTIAKLLPVVTSLWAYSIQPTDDNDIELIQPTDDNNIELIQPTDDNNIELIQPTDDNDIELIQPTDDNDIEFQSFEIEEKFAPAQKNQIQLQFNKVKSAGRKKTKTPFKWIICTQKVAMQFWYLYRHPNEDEKTILKVKLENSKGCKSEQNTVHVST